MFDKNEHPVHAFGVQLKEACKNTRSRWAAWIHVVEGNLTFILSANLSKARGTALDKFTAETKTATWLAGTFTSGRMRWRQTGTYASALGCQRLYVFPNVKEHCALLVGADELSKMAESLYRVLALITPPRGTLPQLPDIEGNRDGKRNEVLQNAVQPQESEVKAHNRWVSSGLPKTSTEADSLLDDSEFVHEIAYNPTEVLKNILALLAGSVNCESAFIAIRAGEVFRCEATWDRPARKMSPATAAGTLPNRVFSISENDILAEIVSKRQGILLEDQHKSSPRSGKDLPFYSQGEPALFTLGLAGGGGMAGSWMGVPVILGQRVIGLVIFMASSAGFFSQEDLRRVTLQVGHLAYVVENAIVISETARYLQQLALLNELASAASLGVEPHDVARRVMDRLCRNFHTKVAGVFLLSPDGQDLHQFGVGDGSAENQEPQTLGEPDVKRLAEIVVENGLPVRRVLSCVNSTEGKEPGEGRLHGLPSRRAELAVPLKYQGVVIGALALESGDRDAFTRGDEQLLVMIASHVAGLFENMRLHEETRERAQRLQDTVRQLQAVRETTLDIGSAQGNGRLVVTDLDALLRRVVERARELVGARAAEIGFVDEGKASVRILARSTGRPGPGEADAGGGDFLMDELPGESAESVPWMADVAGRVVAFGEPLVVNDYDSWDGRLRPDRGMPLRGTTYKTAAGIPLKVQGQVIGALVVMDDRADKLFRPDDIQLLELLAPLVMVWIRNARLYQELQERIEAQRLVEDRLVRSAKLAAVGEMAAGVAHELNNPLTTVAGFIELSLEELPEDSPARPDLELALQEARRARGVVRRLLDFSRPAENQHIRSDLNELVSDVLTLAHHLVRTGGVEMHIELWHDLPWIMVDPGQIKQVLLNLIHNAIQAMPRGGTLTVKTAPVAGPGAGEPGTMGKLQGRLGERSLPPELRPVSLRNIPQAGPIRPQTGKVQTGWPGTETQDWVSISIADSGVGISSEDLERIFEPFFTTRPAGQGTGLGLSVSYSIIAEHGGTLEVDSQPGQGSCFTIYLPVDVPDGEDLDGGSTQSRAPEPREPETGVVEMHAMSPSRSSRIEHGDTGRGYAGLGDT